MKITAAVARPGLVELSIELIDLDSAPRADELLVRMVATGICHTDIAMKESGRYGENPVIFGHEGSGVVEAVGADVPDFVPGDHVVLSFRFCGKCRNCLNGHPAYCESVRPLNFSGTRPDGSVTCSCDGEMVLSHFFSQSSFASHSVVPASAAVKVAKDIPLAMLSPLGCGIQTGAGAVLNILQPKQGASFVLFGAGSVGLAALMAARLLGCAPIIAIDLHENRLAQAKRLGATHVIDPNISDVAAEIARITGDGADFSLDTTSHAAVVSQAFACLASFGRCAYVGLHDADRLVLDDGRFMRGCQLLGVMEGDSTPRKFIPYLIELYREGRFPFDQIIQFYPFSEINRAISEMRHGKIIKPVLMLP